MIVTCKNCKWWGKSEYDCWTTGMRFCRLIEGEIALETIHMGADDDYNLHIETSENFGCILGENK